jgi:hypothetical protein
MAKRKLTEDKTLLVHANGSSRLSTFDAIALDRDDCKNLAYISMGKSRRYRVSNAVGTRAGPGWLMPNLINHGTGETTWLG